MKDSLFLPKHAQDTGSIEKRLEAGPSPDRVLEDKARTPLARLAKKELGDDLRAYSPYEQEEIFGHILDPQSWVFNTALFGRYTGFDFDIPPDAFAGLRPWQKNVGNGIEGVVIGIDGMMNIGVKTLWHSGLMSWYRKSIRENREKNNAEYEESEKGRASKAENEKWYSESVKRREEARNARIARKEFEEYEKVPQERRTNLIYFTPRFTPEEMKRWGGSERMLFLPDRPAWEIFANRETGIFPFYYDYFLGNERPKGWKESQRENRGIFIQEFQRVVREVAESSDDPSVRLGNILRYFYGNVAYNESQPQFLKNFDRRRKGGADGTNCLGKIRGIHAVLEALGYDPETQLFAAVYSGHIEPILRTPEGDVSLEGLEPHLFVPKSDYLLTPFSDMKRMALGYNPQHVSDIIRIESDKYMNKEGTLYKYSREYTNSFENKDSFDGLLPSLSELRSPESNNPHYKKPSLQADEWLKREANPLASLTIALSFSSKNQVSSAQEQRGEGPQARTIQQGAQRPTERAVIEIKKYSDAVEESDKKTDRSNIALLLVASLGVCLGGSFLEYKQWEDSSIAGTESSETLNESPAYRDAESLAFSIMEYHDIAKTIETDGRYVEVSDACADAGSTAAEHTARLLACQRFSDVDFILSSPLEELQRSDDPVKSVAIGMPLVTTTDPYFWDGAFRLIGGGATNPFVFTEDVTIELDGAHLDVPAVTDSLIAGAEMRVLQEKVTNTPEEIEKAYSVEVKVNDTIIGKFTHASDGKNELSLDKKAFEQWQTASMKHKDDALPLWSSTLIQTPPKEVLEFISF